VIVAAATTLMELVESQGRLSNVKMTFNNLQLPLTNLQNSMGSIEQPFIEMLSTPKPSMPLLLRLPFWISGGLERLKIEQDFPSIGQKLSKIIQFNLRKLR
jgi:hypothetical protein